MESKGLDRNRSFCSVLLVNVLGDGRKRKEEKNIGSKFWRRGESGVEKRARNKLREFPFNF